MSSYTHTAAVRAAEKVTGTFYCGTCDSRQPLSERRVIHGKWREIAKCASCVEKSKKARVKA